MYGVWLKSTLVAIIFTELNKADIENISQILVKQFYSSEYLAHVKSNPLSERRGGFAFDTILQELNCQ